jgi:ubiquinone/menaquinone biosynthesis C-methylase UbiE
LSTGEKFVLQEEYKAVYEQSSPEIYDKWAKDGYDENVASFSMAVQSVSQKVTELISSDQMKSSKPNCYKILDAGCGTGRVAAVCFQEIAGACADASIEFDGLDYSAGMLEVAQGKNLYNRLVEADLTKTLDFDSEEFCGVVSSGTFLQGHVGPEAIAELSRVVRPGGFMVFTVRPTYFEETREEWMSALTKNSMAVLAIDMLPYSEGMLAPVLSCRKLTAAPPPSERTTATKALVARGVALLEANGASAFPELRKEGSEWFHGDTYLFSYDLDSNVLFNSASPEKEGSNTLGHPDKNGKLFHDALVRVASTPERRGWVDYMWPKPGETEPSQKWTYARGVSIDGKAAVLMSGFYD